MARLTLLLPARAGLARTPLPVALAKALGRADHLDAKPGEQAQLARHFRLLPDRWALGALTRVADTAGGETLDETRQSGWLRADPAHIRPDINGARLLATGAALSITQDDVDAFLPALRPLFGDVGFLLDAPHPTRWYLRLPRGAELPAFTAPHDALGADVFEHTPEGPHARRWRTLASEAQVVLHNHPRNEVRAQAGLVAVNSLWFWGAGVLPDSVVGDCPTVVSNDPVLQGLAALGSFKVMPIAELPALETADGDVLVDLRAVRDPRLVLEQWLLPALARAAAGDVVLDCADGHRFHLQPSQRWRFWRKPLQAFPE